jgi:glc operon protein GlcG
MNVYVKPSMTLTHAGALAMLQAAVARAEAMQVPQCIAVVDAGGNLLAFARMDGAKVLSQHTATQKAVTAATTRAATGNAPEDHALKLTLASGLRITNLKGGLPIVVEGHVVGGIGVGSGTGDQDVEVAEAGLAALAGAR